MIENIYCVLSNFIKLPIASNKHFPLMSLAFFILSFKSLVCRRLVECGWMDEVTMLCKEKLKNRLSKGQTLKSVTEDDLFNDIAPDARSMI